MKKRLIFLLSCLLVLLVMGSVFCFSGCKEDEDEYTWDIYFSFFYVERVEGGNLGTQAILNEENREAQINTLAMDEYTYIDINALKYLYVNGEKGDSDIERRNGLDLLKNSNFMKYSYTGSDTNVADNLATVLTPPQFLTPEEGYLYLKLDEGIHEFNFDFNLGSKNSDKLKYKVVVNVTNDRKDGLEIKFASNYLKKYSTEETGDYDLYVVDSLPYFNFSLNGADIGTFNHPVDSIVINGMGLFDEDDRIRFTMIAYKMLNGKFKSFGVNKMVQKGLYYVEVDARDSREYKSVVYRCYVFIS